nr:retrovirus-related Pol polyprotein from transposon TNT 1-94 [Tanacetum cinerariifolium]GEX40006.1 retrovirus-related Pol polyprotein from transposon TNT 1-94 [Tanacetum cinerariifolium]
MVDAKEIWEAIKSIFGGNDESKKRQKYLLKQQFESFSVSSSEGLHKGYDRFQTLLSQLEIHGAGVLHEDENQNFDDLYTYLKVFERDVKGTTASSSSNSQNMAFMSTDNTSSTNDVSMISMRIKKFHKRTRRKLQFDTRDTVGFKKTKVECFNCHKKGHFARDYRAKWNQDNRRRDGRYNGNKARDNSRRPASQDDSKALVTIDGRAVDWSGHVEEDTQNFAMMAYSSSNSGSDNESVFMNKDCDLANTHVNDRYAKGMHAVPPPMTGNYMPSGLDVEIDYFKFICVLKQTSANESYSKSVDNASSDSDFSVETTTSMPAPVEDAPKVVSEPKVWTDASIIEEYESDSDDLVSNVQENIEKPSFAFTEPVKQAKSPRENDDPHKALKDKGIVDSGCSRHMTGNKAHLAYYQEFKGGSVAFGGSNGRITGKGTIKAENQGNKFVGLQKANHSVGTQTNADQGANSKKIDLYDEHFVLPVCAPVSDVGPSRALNDDEPLYPDDPSMPHLEDIYASPTTEIFTNSSYDDKGVFTDFNNLETTVNKQQKNNHKDFQHCLFACFLSQVEPKKISQALEDKSWVDAMQEELLQFQIQKGIVVRNKARLVAQGHRQEEKIDYDEVFAHVARIKVIRIFLAFASYMSFIVYQMDVKSAFLYGTIDEEVYVTQPPGFVDPKFPNKVYKVVKAIYGLHQAPRAWYATLSTFLERSRYRRGDIDKTLFIKQDKKDNMLVQVYVDDIIFGSTKKSWCDEFEELMKNRFQMSYTSELAFYFGLQVKQKKDGIFISQDKYVAEILKKFNFLSVKTASTPIETQKPLVKDKEATDVDVYLYRSMIGSLMYLTAFRLNIMFAVCACSRFQTIVATSTTEVEYVAAAHCSALVKGRLLEVTTAKQSKELASPKQTALVDNQLGDMSHHQDIYENPSLTKKVFANMKRVGTCFSRVITPLFESMLVQAVEDVGEAQDDVYIPTEPSTSKPLKKHKSKKQQPKVPKAPSPVPSLEHQLPSPSTDPVPTDQDSLTLQELIDLCKTLSNKVLALESQVIDLKSSFTHRIAKLGDRVDQLEKENKALNEKSFKTTQVDTAAPVENMEKSFKQGRMTADMDEDVEEAQAKVYNLDLQHAKKVLSMQDTDEEEPAEMEEVFEVVKAAKLMTDVVTTAQPTTTAIQVPKPSASRRKMGVIIQDPEETAASVIVHLRVQSRTKDNTVMRYQALKRKHVTEAQVRKNMMVYLKNMAGFKMDLFKGMTYSEIRPIFEKHYNSIQAFLEKGEEEVTVQEKGNKRQVESLEQDIAKKLRIDEEAEEFKTHIQIVANDDDDVYIEATPLASMVPVIDYRIHHENNKPYYKIIRADGTHKLFLSFITLLKNFDREDLKAL